MPLLEIKSQVMLYILSAIYEMNRPFQQTASALEKVSVVTMPYTLFIKNCKPRDGLSKGIFINVSFRRNESPKFDKRPKG